MLPVVAAIGLGSNIGDRAGHIAAAVDAIAALPLTQLLAVSSIRETQPWGPVPQGPFLNGVALVRTCLTARGLLTSLQRIERSRGRNRAAEQRWGPRTLDLDLLVFGTATINEPDLQVPHPRMLERDFVMVPLREVLASDPSLAQRLGLPSIDAPR